MGEQTRTAPIVRLYAPSLPRTSEKAVMYAGELVESGPSRKLLDDPGYPYTRALSRAFPTIGDPASRMAPAGLPGDPPDPAALGRGRPFAARCPDVHDVCGSTPVQLWPAGPGATVGVPGGAARFPERLPGPGRARTVRGRSPHDRPHHRHGRRTHRGHAARSGGWRPVR
ncbi:hypothetical protein ADK77_12835 [Streptomyces antibioticus]|nr:hypothetical protein ADK77_12835 [Streptomyces antibioticus]